MGNVLANAALSGAVLGLDTTNASGGTFTLPNNIAVSGLALAKLGTGSLLLSGSNTFTGSTTLYAGTLQLGSATALGDGGNPTNISGGTLDVAGQAASTGIVTLANGAIIDSSGTGSLTGIAVDVQNGTIGANLAGAAAALTMNGSGLVTLSGSNSYGGGANVSSGTLHLGSAAALGASSNPVNVSGGDVGRRRPVGQRRQRHAGRRQHRR